MASRTSSSARPGLIDEADLARLGRHVVFREGGMKVHGRTDLDPEVAAAFALSPMAAMDIGALDFAELPSLRDAMASMPRPPSPPTTTVSEERLVPGLHGAPDVAVRVYRPAGAALPVPAVLWIHGGGYMFGSGLTEDVRLNAWAETLDCVVVSVDYRLAPEHPYPAPLEDCYAALRWTAEQSDELGVDPARIVIVGQSAGGGLAAGLALLARDRAEVAISYQLLIYPMIDDRNTTPSSQLDAVVWSRAANFLGWRAYLGPFSGETDVPVYAAPSRASDLSGLPPTFIGVGTHDVFRDEDIAYALALLAAGVETELHVYPGAPHGFEMITPEAAVARRCRRDIDDALARALRR
jgi:acetyl esterase/lipase